MHQILHFLKDFFFPYSICIIIGQTEENGQEVTKILHQYTADKLSCFGELALMYVGWVISYVDLSFSIFLWFSYHGVCYILWNAKNKLVDS